MWIILEIKLYVLKRRKSFSNAVCMRRHSRTGAESFVTYKKPIAILA
jgi:hypothetical protein